MDPSASPAQPATDDRWALYSAALEGPRRDYYLERFRRIEAGRALGLSWNWAALPLTYVWLRYRKMYAYSWLYLPVSTPALLLWSFYVLPDACATALAGGRSLAGSIMLALIVLGFLLPPLVADRLYFRFVRQKVAKSMHVRPAREERAVGSFWGALLGMTAIVCFIVFIMLPQYSDYTTRAKFSEVILAGSSYRTQTHEFFEKYKKLPSKIDDIGGFSGPVGKVKAITVESNGTIRIVAGFSPAEGRSLVLIPTAREGAITWTCRGVDIPDTCLPPTCSP